MKYLISSLLVLASFYGGATEQITSSLKEEGNFQAISKIMQEKSMGLVLMLHAEQCPYCVIMENEILSPMVKSGEYESKVLLRKLQIDGSGKIVDFSGLSIEPSAFPKRYNSWVTPTLVFLDYQGKERVKQMVGINTVELFGAYLDAEIEKLQQTLAKDKSPIKKRLNE